MRLIIRSLISLLLVFMLGDCTAQSEFTRYYHANGIVSSEGFLSDGKPEGYWKSFNEQGQLISEGNRYNFMLDSIWRFYRADGSLSKTITYSEGKKNGLAEGFDELGNLQSRVTYLNDLRQGSFTEYFVGGDVSKRIEFEADKENGRGYEYGRDGRIITVLDYRSGVLRKKELINRYDKAGLKQGAWKEFYTNGKIRSECHYVDDQKDGVCKEFNKEGSLKEIEKYSAGIEEPEAQEAMTVDIRSTYYPDGKVASLGSYSKEGNKQGLFRSFDQQGNVTGASIFKNDLMIAKGIVDEFGVRQGSWLEYYLSGEKRAEGTYVDGQREGAWIYYYRSGKVEQKGKYQKGKSHGQWKWYYESRALHRDEYYRKGREEGEAVEYAEDGEIITKGEFIDGFKEGKWFYKVGDHTEEGSYIAGSKDGVWVHLFDNGKKNFIGEYVNGEGKGKHKYYYPNGKIKLEGKFKGGVRSGDWYHYDEYGNIEMTVRYKNGAEIKIDGEPLPEPYSTDS